MPVVAFIAEQWILLCSSFGLWKEGTPSTVQTSNYVYCRCIQTVYHFHQSSVYKLQGDNQFVAKVVLFYKHITNKTDLVYMTIVNTRDMYMTC